MNDINNLNCYATLMLNTIPNFNLLIKTKNHATIRFRFPDNGEQYHY
jgi:hypothetical protein